jgi:SAM-dependent methyltransferase
MKQHAFRGFAKYYDLIYKDKNYAKEADFVEACFKEYLKPKKTLEIGCGTGNYTAVFSERGYQITGIDNSEEMLEIARSKCNCNFLKMDIRNLSLPSKFDCCLALFAVMGYLTGNGDLMKALTKVREHLTNDGLFIFDVWNGLAVLRSLPENRIKEIESDKLKIVRYAHPALKASDHICQVDYKLVVMKKDSNEISEITEKHMVRFFFPQEIRHYLECAGFELLKLCPFLDINGKVTETVWNMTVIARAGCVKS